MSALRLNVIHRLYLNYN